MPYVKRDWRMWAQRVVCKECIYYNECMLDHDCRALEILVKIYEDMDSNNTEE